MMFKDKNGEWHYIQNEKRLFARVWGGRWDWGVKLYIGTYHIPIFYSILEKLEEYSQIFSHEEKWFIEDLKREFIDRTDDLDESFTENDVKQIIERVKSGV